MKAKNLELLKNNGIRVPDFIVVESEKEMDLSFSDSELFAVRSSASQEDQAGQSYAGQFETVLNVPREEVPEAVRRVLRSAEKETVFLMTLEGFGGIGGTLLLAVSDAAVFSRFGFYSLDFSHMKP